jgi:hypothetical protein
VCCLSSPGISVVSRRRASFVVVIDWRRHQVWYSTFKKRNCFYSRRKAVSHLSLLSSALLILSIFCAPGTAQESNPPASHAKINNSSYLTVNEVDEIIHRYQQGKATDQVAIWTQWSRSASHAASPQFRKSLIQRFPAGWLSLRNSNPDLDKNIKTFLHPLLSLYGRDYEIFLINTRKPALLIDSGAVLVMGTGILSRARSDDELFGFVAHEIAYAQFAERSIAAKELYASLVGRKEANSDGAREALKELSRIELECDAVAARTLSVMGMDPTQFIKSMERINNEFPEETTRGAEMGVNWHPATSMRLLVVEALAAGEALKQKAGVSKLLRRIQAALSDQSKEG